MAGARAKKRIGLSIKVLIGFAFGIALGAIFGKGVLQIKFIGDIFMKLLKMLVMPLVFLSIVDGVTNIGDIKKLRKVGTKALIYFIVLTLAAGALGIVIANLMKPGTGFVIASETASAYKATKIPTVVDTILSMVPDNPFSALTSFNMILTIVFALFFGASITALGDKGKEIVTVVHQATNAMYKMTDYVMATSPIGIAALIACSVGQYGFGFLGPLSRFIITDYIGQILFILLAYVPLVMIVAKVDIRYFFKKILRVWLMTTSTCSSAGTLPVTMDVATKDFHVKEDLSGFILPLGATMNMNGAAIYLASVTVFASQIYGINLSIGQQIIIVLTATLLSVGAPGIPGGGVVLAVMIIGMLGLPVEVAGMIAGIYRLLDMAHTTMNVTGDVVTDLCIAKTDGFLEEPAPATK